MEIKGKIVFITGASAGIGEACAEVFAGAGANLILVARRKDKVDQLAENLKNKYNIQTLTASLDVRDYKQVETFCSSLSGDWTKIDILINNAGLARGLSKIYEGQISDWEEMIDTNIKGLLYVTRLIMPKMVDQGEGMIINIASIAGREVYPNGNVYCASKSGVKSLSQAMMLDSVGKNIRVVNVDPGLVETEFAKVRFHGDDNKAETVYKGYKPLTGHDVADVCLFAATRPAHVTIQDVLITPTAQANTTTVHKEL